MNGAASWSEHQHMQGLTCKTKRLVAPLTVVIASILNDECAAPVEVLGKCEWQSTIFFVAQTFDRIVGHSHFYCTHNNYPSTHFFGIMLGRAIGVEIVHVAYKGGTPMLNDLMGGQIACGMDTHIELIPLHQAGKIRILASFADKRSILIPDVPTMAELGDKDATGSGWYSLWAPAKTPAATIAALNKALNGALANADVKEKLARTGTEPTTSTPEGLEKFRLEEIDKWRPVIAASGFKAD